LTAEESRENKEISAQMVKLEPTAVLKNLQTAAKKFQKICRRFPVPSVKVWGAKAGCPDLPIWS
jgi:hypothetical protein